MGVLSFKSKRNVLENYRVFYFIKETNLFANTFTIKINECMLILRVKESKVVKERVKVKIKEQFICKYILTVKWINVTFDKNLVL